MFVLFVEPTTNTVWYWLSLEMTQREKPFESWISKAWQRITYCTENCDLVFQHLREGENDEK